MLNFHDWLQLREASTADMRVDIGKGYKFNPGDLICFNIRKLDAKLKQKQKRGVPLTLANLNPVDLVELGLKTVDTVRPQGASNGGELVLVKSDKMPSQLGYKKMSDIQVNARLGLIGLPADQIEDITFLLDIGAQLNAHTNKTKLGLLYDPAIIEHLRIIRNIRKARDQRLETPPDNSGAANVLGQDQAPVTPGRSPLAIRPMPQSQQTDPWAQLGLPQIQSKRPLGNVMKGIKARKSLDDLLNQQPEPEAIPMNPFRQTASYDPSVSYYDPHWKSHNDTKRYDYIIG